MLIFGYRHSSSGYIRAAISIILGLLIMIWPQWISYIVGGVILLVGIVSIVTAFYMRGMRVIVSSLVSASITTVVGLLILLHADKFPEVIILLLGLLLFIFGLYQLGSYFAIRRIVNVPMYDFILSGISACAGLALLIWSGETSKLFFIFLGGAILLYGISTLLATVRVRMAMDEDEKERFSPYEDLSKKNEKNEK